MNRAGGDQRRLTGPPSSSSSTDSATEMPNWCTSTLMVESAGEARRHSVESSQAIRDSASGTPIPRSFATPSPATAITSLSYRMAVGRSGRRSSWAVSLAPASAE